MRSRFLTGSIDELRHWSTARTEDKIRGAMIYSGAFTYWPLIERSHAQSDGLMAQYPLDDVSPARRPLEIIDVSGYNHNGPVN